MITHVLSDGTVLEDITGHIVKREDAPTLYKILEQAEEKRNERNYRSGINGHFCNRGNADRV